MNIKPLEDRIVIKRSAAETTTSGGIILTESAQEKPQKGEVVAVGPGRQLENGQKAPLDVAVGDVVYFGKYAGTDIQLDGEDVIIMKESDVLAIVK